MFFESEERPHIPFRALAKNSHACYDFPMITTLKEMLPKIETWSSEDQEALATAAREIELGRMSPYNASPAELAGIDRGLADSQNGRFAPDQAVAALRAKFQSA